LQLCKRFAIINTVKQQNKTEHNMQAFMLSVAIHSNNTVINNTHKTLQANDLEQALEQAEELVVDGLVQLYLDMENDDSWEWEEDGEESMLTTIHMDADSYFAITVQAC
jgi:isoleucyl-tRNA synthetase